MESSKVILVDREGSSGIATVTINRPGALNALTKSMMVDLAKTFSSLDADDHVKVIILTGSGTRAFSAGVDLSAAEDVFKGAGAAAGDENSSNNLVHQMEICRKPIIGAINGFAVAGAFEIALACDILIASRAAIFMDTHARWIMPAWGLSQKLSRIIGANRAREVSLTAMHVTAEMAEMWGLVNHVVEGNELLKKAKQVAESILRNDQDLLLQYKSLINDGFQLDLAHGLELNKERANIYYDGMTTKEQFNKMQKFIEARGLETISSKM